MLAAGVSVVLAVLIKALVIISLVLGGAYALTTYVELPDFVDVLIWLVAGGYAVAVALSTFAVLAALVATGSQATRRIRR